MKTKPLTLLLMLLSLTAFAQNDLKARIEYEDAETAFASGDFIKTISHLEEAKKLLKKENSKILYLQILAEKELTKKDTIFYSQVKKSIGKFEKLPDYKTFSTEKKAEIYRINKNLVDDKKSVINEMNSKKNNELAFQNFSYGNWDLNISIEELAQKHSDSNFFKARPKKYKKSSDYFGYNLFPYTKYGFDLTAILLDDKNIVKGYYYSNNNPLYKGELSIIAVKEVFKPVVDEHSQKFGFSPQIEEKDKMVNYIWKKNDKTIVFQTFGLEWATGKDPSFRAYSNFIVLIN